MSSNRQLIKDMMDTSTLTGTGKGGRLNPDQAKQFISYMTDNAALLKDTRLEQMNAPEKYLDFFLLGSRIIRKGVEGTAPTEVVGNDTARKELRSIKVMLPADITTEFLEDNIEKEAAQDRIARELAMQFGNDLADLMINGDTTATGTDASFLTIADGIIKQAKDSSNTHKVTMSATPAAADYKDTILPAMLKAMPNKFKRDRTNMRFYCSSAVADAYIMSLAARLTQMGDNILVNGDQAKFLGIQLFPVEYMPDDVIILTHRLNLVSGVQRDMTVHSQFNPRRDVTEYSMYMRVDPGKIVWDDALVIASA